MSKKLGSTMHTYSMEGLGGYIEEFVPTLAKETGLKVVSVPVPLFISDRCSIRPILMRQISLFQMHCTIVWH